MFFNIIARILMRASDKIIDVWHCFGRLVNLNGCETRPMASKNSKKYMQRAHSGPHVFNS